jgi:hypothetical protein
VQLLRVLLHVVQGEPAAVAAAPAAAASAGSAGPLIAAAVAVVVAAGGLLGQLQQSQAVSARPALFAAVMQPQLLLLRPG